MPIFVLRLAHPKMNTRASESEHAFSDRHDGLQASCTGQMRHAVGVVVVVTVVVVAVVMVVVVQLLQVL